ncbi:hypothetical protein ACFRSX_29340 [Streptomyces goshikiensis]|nr:hypothetical protein [Streptomyces sp. CB02120-2]
MPEQLTTTTAEPLEARRAGDDGRVDLLLDRFKEMADLSHLLRP